jgi:hypothetical protein
MSLFWLLKKVAPARRPWHVTLPWKRRGGGKGRLFSSTRTHKAGWQDGGTDARKSPRSSLQVGSKTCLDISTALIRAVVGLADLVLIPTRPSPDDLDAVGRTIDIVDDAKKPMVFVINGATKNARITGQAAIALSQSGTVATATLHHSVSFPTSGIDGRTVGELDPKSSSAKEVAELWSYVAARLRKSAKVAA